MLTEKEMLKKDHALHKNVMLDIEDGRLILASASPRRRELMEKLGAGFTVEVSEADESIPDDVQTEKTAEYLSGIKAEAVYNKHRNEGKIIIGSDTIVVCDGEIFGKPADKDMARSMLKKLSGNTHEVLTGVTIISDTRRISFTNTAKVVFNPMTDDEINGYIETGEPMDKAGAYGIQGIGGLFVKGIAGDYYTVMGFPISQIYNELKLFI